MGVTAARSKAESYPEKLLLRALVISLMVHIVAFGGWKWAKAHGWMQHSTLPKWLQLISAKAITAQAKKNPPPASSQPAPLLFVDVDPSLAVAEPPKNAKYYSAASTQLASPVKKPDAIMPEITGRQDKILKTTDDAKLKPKPLQPSPPAPEKTEKAEAKARPKQTYTPGDLAIAKPQPKAQEKKGEADSVREETAKPHQRPRLLSEVSKDSLPGDKIHQTGGGARLALDSSLDVTKTSYGNYDREFIDAIRNNWDKILRENVVNISGKTVIEFRLWYTGRLSDIRMTENSSGVLPGIYCQTAISSSSPFKPWSSPMRHELGADFRDIRFTFYYLPP